MFTFSAFLLAKVDSNLPVYTKVSGGLSGTINSVGSDTLNNLMDLWSKEFQLIYPNVRFQIEGKGSSTAPPALISGAAQIGPMSRSMKSSEQQKFESTHGYKATKVELAIDALAVFVHKDNAIKGLSLKQIDSIFSSSFKRGGENIVEWTELNQSPLYFAENISIYGRNSASGTYGFFKKVALKKGNYKSSVQEQPGSSAVVSSISNDYTGVGYSGIGYLTSGVRAVPLSRVGNTYYEPNAINSLNGRYPLARTLNIYVNKKPNRKLNKVVYEFIRFILSKVGQEIVVKDSYFPLPAKDAAKILKSIK